MWLVMRGGEKGVAGSQAVAAGRGGSVAVMGPGLVLRCIGPVV